MLLLIKMIYKVWKKMLIMCWCFDKERFGYLLFVVYLGCLVNLC